MKETHSDEGSASCLLPSQQLSAAVCCSLSLSLSELVQLEKVVGLMLICVVVMSVILYIHSPQFTSQVYIPQPGSSNPIGEDEFAHKKMMLKAITVVDHCGRLNGITIPRYYAGAFDPCIWQHAWPHQTVPMVWYTMFIHIPHFWIPVLYCVHA